MKVHSKLFNRTISLLYLCAFVIGIFCVGASTYVIVNLYNENQRLEQIKQNLEDGLNNQDVFEEFHFDDYYSVYVDGDYAIYDDKETTTTIYFTK
jgi:hypothetical protein